MPRKGRKKHKNPAPVYPKSEVSIIMEKLGNLGLVLLLFETPSGFAIFHTDGVQLFQKNALEKIWVDYANDYTTHHVIWLKEFKAFKNKSIALNSHGIDNELAQMIKKCHLPGQLLAVEKREHKTIIEQKLKISCICDAAVTEVMWGIKHLMSKLVPQEESELPMEERLQLSYGLQTVLKRHGFDVKPEMVNVHNFERIIDAARVLYDCDLCETSKHHNFLLSVGMCLKEVSGIECQSWNSLKIGTALKVICDPENKEGDTDLELMFSKNDLHRLITDARLYDGKILKCTCMRVYREIVWARKVKTDTKMLLNMLLVMPEEGFDMPEEGFDLMGVEKQEVVHEAGHAGVMPEIPPMRPGRAGSISEPTFQEVKQEVV